MKWFIGIAAVMIVTHLYFRWGRRRLEQPRRDEPPAQD